MDGVALHDLVELPLPIRRDAQHPEEIPFDMQNPSLRRCIQATGREHRSKTQGKLNAVFDESVRKQRWHAENGDCDQGRRGRAGILQAQDESRHEQAAAQRPKQFPPGLLHVDSWSEHHRAHGTG